MRLYVFKSISFCCTVKGVSINSVNPVLYGQFSHVLKTRAEEESSLNPGLLYCPVSTFCGGLDTML